MKLLNSVNEHAQTMLIFNQGDEFLIGERNFHVSAWHSPVGFSERIKT
jgi:hypothetical protein